MDILRFTIADSIKMESFNLFLNCIKSLDIKLRSLFKDSVGVKNDIISDDAIINKNIQDSKNTKLTLEKSLADLGFTMNFKKSLDEDLRGESFKCKIGEWIILNGKKYSLQELSDLILENNKRLNYSQTNSFILEKECILTWLGYNTPKEEDITITPLLGTSLGEPSPSSSQIFLEWMIASRYLIYELNIWNKVLFYLNNIKNSPELILTEHKKAYSYYIYRQFLMQIDLIDTMSTSSNYIVDSTKDEYVYREIIEDLLYIYLNLLLADKILGNTILQMSLYNEAVFLETIKRIIQDHYIENKYAYTCLNNMRRYKVDNYNSVEQIKQTYKLIKEDKI